MRTVVAMVAAVAFAAGMSACAASASPHGDAHLQAQATISADDARGRAMAVRAGHVKAWELEREDGGSGLRYSFVITSADGDYEVGIDARDGAVLENAREGGNPD